MSTLLIAHHLNKLPPNEFYESIKTLSRIPYGIVLIKIFNLYITQFNLYLKWRALYCLSFLVNFCTQNREKPDTVQI